MDLNRTLIAERERFAAEVQALTTQCLEIVRAQRAKRPKGRLQWDAMVGHMPSGALRPSPQSCSGLRAYLEREGATAEPTAAIAKEVARGCRVAQQKEMREAREMAEVWAADRRRQELAQERKRQRESWEAESEASSAEQ